MIRKKKIAIIASLGALCVMLAAFAWLAPSGMRASAKADAYETVVIKKGDIKETVSGTGALTAVGTVNVLTQLTGTLDRVYVDFNDTVKKGQPLAALNTDMLRISRKEAEAGLIKARAQLAHDQLQFESNKKLYERKLISEFDLHASQTGYDTSRALLLQAEAQHERAMLNLNQYAVILSPISGIVLNRNVDEGQTVVAGANSDSQTLFTLAENLKTMEIEVQVDEMDISRIEVGQAVSFSVASYPEKNFAGKVSQIRLMPKTSESVVKYTIVVRAENQEGLLLPGMTATAEFIVTEKKGVLLVANGALRFKPSAAVEAAARRRLVEERLKDRPAEERSAALKRYDEAQKTGAGQNSLLTPRMGGPFGQPKQAPRAANGAAGAKQLWLRGEDGGLVLRMVRTGASDGANTEILEAPELEGRPAVVKAR